MSVGDSVTIPSNYELLSHQNNTSQIRWYDISPYSTDTKLSLCHELSNAECSHNNTDVNTFCLLQTQIWIKNMTNPKQVKIRISLGMEDL